MSLTDEYLLGNPSLHLQFCQATEILAVLVSQAPNPVNMVALENFTGYPAKDISTLCSSLWQAMLITPNANGEGWILITPAHQITLEDVFRCVIESHKLRAGSALRNLPEVRMRPDVEVFVNQATLTINQAVFKHLRQFPLSRLRFDGSGAVRFSPHFLNMTSYDADSEHVAFSDITLISPLT